MNSKFKKESYRQDVMLFAWALLLLGLLTGFFIWSVQQMKLAVDRSVRVDPRSAGETDAKLEGAKKILEERK